VTKASFLQNKSEAIPVTVRFSNFAGLPDIPDNHPGLASPRGLAIKFQLGDGSTSDIISHSVNGFPSSTAESFRDLLIALGTSGPDAAKPTPLDKFLETHPAAKEFLTSPKPAPVSYATLPFFGVNAFKFTNAAGAAVYGRYRFVPMAGAQYLTDEQRDKSSPNYLKDEMAKRLAAGPVEFKLLLQVANAGDPIEDPSLTWADDRKLVDLGLIRLTKLVENSDEAQKELLFLPDSVPDGIEPADPMILERSGAYGVSFGRRHQ
jgi:catalase